MKGSIEMSGETKEERSREIPAKDSRVKSEMIRRKTKKEGRKERRKRIILPKKFENNRKKKKNEEIKKRREEKNEIKERKVIHIYQPLRSGRIWHQVNF